MERPSDLFDREAEWRDLNGFATGQGSGIQLALVRGRALDNWDEAIRALGELPSPTQPA